MPKQTTTSKPQSGADKIVHGKNGGTQFTTYSSTPSGGQKQTSYHYPPASVGSSKPKKS